MHAANQISLHSLLLVSLGMKNIYIVRLSRVVLMYRVPYSRFTPRRAVGLVVEILPREIHETFDTFFISDYCNFINVNVSYMIPFVRERRQNRDRISDMIVNIYGSET